MGEITAFIYDDVLSEHIISNQHPMKPSRLRYTYELLNSYNAFVDVNSQLIEPRRAISEEILQFHSMEYLEAVKNLSRGNVKYNPNLFNFSEAGDNPIYKGMFNAAMWSTGASITATELILKGKVNKVLNIAGGLHHAMPDKASGFCIFNDPVLAIKMLTKKGAKVAYIDVDAHHGDGVQYAFYDRDDVLTISLHESGEYIFPGTGSVDETGTGKGRGYSVNVPLYPFTNDEIYLWVVREVIPLIVNTFNPDYLVTQLGIDTHFRDPITHMGLTVQGFSNVVQELSDLAKPWIGMGGGGYDVMAVARAWTSAYGVMSKQMFPDQIPSNFREWYGISTLSDVNKPETADEVLEAGRKFAEQNVVYIHNNVLPLLRS